MDMETTQGISLCSYLHLKLPKTPCFSYFLFNKIAEQEGGTSSAWTGGGEGIEEVVQTMYTHVSKCKNDKIKVEKKEKGFYYPDNL
jgi:hypothetical protein